jgi:hypothetical protein
MRRPSRILVPLTAFAVVVVVAFLLSPTGARGGERLNEVGSTDRFVFGHDAVIDSSIPGSLQVYGGNVEVNAPVAGDLLVFGGNVVLRESGRVDGNVIYAGGNVTGAEGRVGGRVYSLMTLQGAAATMNRTAVVVSLLLAWLLVAVVVTLFSGREVRFSSVEVRASVLHCFALGLVAFTSFVLTAIVFSYLVPYVIGIPLLAALAVFAILTKVYGMIAVFHAVGAIVAAPRTHEQLMARRWFRGDLAMVVIGLLILGAARLIPGLGPIVWSCASVFGVGVALATKFGRRDPVFLAFREAEA